MNQPDKDNTTKPPGIKTIIGKRIPVSTAKRLSKQYNYDHVIIVAWNTEDHQSWWTTYGANRLKCKYAAWVSENLKKVF